MSLKERKIVLRDLVPACAPIMTPFSWKECYLDSDGLEGLIHPLCLLKGNNLITSSMYKACWTLLQKDKHSFCPSLKDRDKDLCVEALQPLQSKHFRILL